MAINSISAETAISPFSLLPKKKGGNGKIQTNPPPCNDVPNKGAKAISIEPIAVSIKPARKSLYGVVFCN